MSDETLQAKSAESRKRIHRGMTEQLSIEDIAEIEDEIAVAEKIAIELRALEVPDRRERVARAATWTTGIYLGVGLFFTSVSALIHGWGNGGTLSPLLAAYCTVIVFNLASVVFRSIFVRYSDEAAAARGAIETAVRDARALLDAPTSARG